MLNSTECPLCGRGRPEEGSSYLDHSPPAWTGNGRNSCTPHCRQSITSSTVTLDQLRHPHKSQVSILSSWSVMPCPLLLRYRGGYDWLGERRWRNDWLACMDDITAYWTKTASAMCKVYAATSDKSGGRMNVYEGCRTELPETCRRHRYHYAASNLRYEKQQDCIAGLYRAARTAAIHHRRRCSHDHASKASSNAKALIDHSTVAANMQSMSRRTSPTVSPAS